MDLTKLGHGKNPPAEIYAVIEVSMNSDPVKYEFDKDVGALFVDRFLGTSMNYPCNYGFMPNTLAGDGDPVDILVYSNFQIIPGSVIAVRPIGVLYTQDEKGNDEKILAVPITKLDPNFENIKSYKDLPQHFINKVTHFFEHYKDLETGKWVKVLDWKDAEDAQKLILQGIKNYKQG
jgi:inorganic pyrophosphatase